MPYLECNGRQIEVDEDGFITDPEQWDTELAKFIAETEDLHERTQEHWDIINYLNDYFKKFGIAPMVRKLCKDTKCDIAHMYELFPSGPAKGACKIAGLPKPTGCV